jgi:phosphoglycolate phosphatase-like HAD superfamily hydrolase
MQREAESRGLAELSGIIVSPSGVLYDDSLWWRWLLQLLSRMGLHTHPAAFWEVWRRDYYDDVCLGRRDLWEALREMLLAAGLASGQADEVCAAARPRWRTLGEQPHPLPGVLATLARLTRTGMSLAIVAHAPQTADQFTAQLEQSGLGKFFQLTISSRVMQSPPTHPAFLEGGLAHWPVALAQTALLSGQQSELHAALQANVRTIALNCPAADEADAHISRIDELPTPAACADQHASAG